MNNNYWTHPLLSTVPHGFGLRGAIPTPDFFPFIKGPVCELNQVHGVKLVTVNGPFPAGKAPDGDALATRVPGLVIGVRSADCAPILMAHESGWVAALHAGWRSAAAGIVDISLTHLTENLGLDPGGFAAVIGPCIGPGRFEVGGDVVAAFGPPGADFVTKAPFREGKERFTFDLPRFLTARLHSRGVGRVGFTGGCTVESSDLFYSFRREGAHTGRHHSLIAPPGN